ncbi:MAG: uroporphyrinogen-III synthase, partial [Rhizobiales bacterium]|nr:uroporphyrinogen-III synthase [Hyphomicrobiales bacterium]
PQPKAGEHAAALAKAGFAPLISPVLEIVPITQPKWARPVPDLVLVSSLNGLEFLSPDWHTALQNIPIIVSGTATGERARQFGFSKIKISPGQGSRGMVDLVREYFAANPQQTSLLYIAGTPRTPFLENELGPQFNLQVVEVYASQLVSELSEEFYAAYERNIIAGVTLFSSRSAVQAATLLRKLAPTNKNVLTSIEAVCISPSVADAARQAGFASAVAATLETEDAIIKKLVDQLNINNK